MADSSEQARIVLMTAPEDAAARQIVRQLVGEGLLACANVMPGVTSIYRWEGRVEEQPEALIVAKTTAASVPELEARFLELHPYEVPEFVVLSADHVQPRYLEWLAGAVRSAWPK